MLATCPSDVNHQGHLHNCAVVPFLINTHPITVKIPLPPRHLSQTLAPLLALDYAGDEALSCRDFLDAVLTPAADLVFSTVAVGVFRHKVRAWEIELLGIHLRSV